MPSADPSSRLKDLRRPLARPGQLRARSVARASVDNAVAIVERVGTPQQVETDEDCDGSDVRNVSSIVSLPSIRPFLLRQWVYIWLLANAELSSSLIALLLSMALLSKPRLDSSPPTSAAISKYASKVDVQQSRRKSAVTSIVKMKSSKT